MSAPCLHVLLPSRALLSLKRRARGEVRLGGRMLNKVPGSSWADRWMFRQTGRRGLQGLQEFLPYRAPFAAPLDKARGQGRSGIESRLWTFQVGQAPSVIGFALSRAGEATVAHGWYHTAMHDEEPRLWWCAGGRRRLVSHAACHLWQLWVRSKGRTKNTQEQNIGGRVQP